MLLLQKPGLWRSACPPDAAKGAFEAALGIQPGSIRLALLHELHYGLEAAHLHEVEALEVELAVVRVVHDEGAATALQQLSVVAVDEVR